jgi:hypothetical protein
MAMSHRAILHSQSNAFNEGSGQKVVIVLAVPRRLDPHGLLYRPIGKNRDFPGKQQVEMNWICLAEIDVVFVMQLPTTETQCVDTSRNRAVTKRGRTANIFTQYDPEKVARQEWQVPASAE